MALLVTAAKFRFPGDYAIAFGVEWRRITGLNNKGRPMSERDEIAQYAKEIQGGATLGLRIRRGGKPAPVVGLLPDGVLGKAAKKVAGRKAPKILAAAEVFAGTVGETNAALVVTFGPDHYAFIGVRSRLPAVGFDVVGNTEQVLAAAEEFISRVKQTGVSFYFMGRPGPDFDLAMFEPNSALPELFAPANVAKRSDASLRSLRRQSLVVPVAILSMVLAAGYWFYDDWQTQQAREAAQRARKASDAEKAANVPSPKMGYAQSVAAAIGAQPPAAPAAEALIGAIGPLPDAAAPGWNFDKADCTALACTVTWKRADEKARATNEAIAGVRTGVSFLTDLMSAQEALKVEAPTSAVVDIDTLPATQEFLVKTGSRFQVMKRAGLAVTLGNGKASLAIVCTPPTGVPTDDLALVRSGTWEIGGDYALRGALIELPPNMTLSTLAVELVPAARGAARAGATFYPVKFTAKGSFYVR